MSNLLILLSPTTNICRSGSSNAIPAAAELVNVPISCQKNCLLICHVGLTTVPCNLLPASCTSFPSDSVSGNRKEWEASSRTMIFLITMTGTSGIALILAPKIIFALDGFGIVIPSSEYFCPSIVTSAFWCWKSSRVSTCSHLRAPIAWGETGISRNCFLSERLLMTNDELLLSRPI